MVKFMNDQRTISWADGAAAAAGLLILLAYFVLPWLSTNTLPTPESTEAVVQRYTVNEASAILIMPQARGVPLLLVSGILGLVAGVVGFFNIVVQRSEERGFNSLARLGIFLQNLLATRQGIALAQFGAGVIGLLFYIITWLQNVKTFAELSAITNIGFWLGIAGCIVLIGQLYLPRPTDDVKPVAQWLYTYIFFPLGQMLVFIVGSVVVLTALSYLLAFFFPEPRENIILADQIGKQLPSMIRDGILLGFIYAMIALGYTLVYGVLKFINFAHSEIFMFGSVIAYVFLLGLQDLASSNGMINLFGLELNLTFLRDILQPAFSLLAWNPVLLVTATVLLSGLFSGLLAMLIERVAYRPLRGAPRLVPLISAIGVSLFLQDFVRAVMGSTRNVFNMTFPINDLPWAKIPIPIISGPPPVVMRPAQLAIVIGALIMLLFLNWFVNGTKMGRGIRAVSQDMTTAGLMGINVNRIIALTFFIGGALGGAAGALQGMNIVNITPYWGFQPGLKAFIAAVLGGIGSVTGALLGGLALGMIEAFLNGILVYFEFFGGRYTDIFAFSVLILILIFRPSGLLGERVDEKV
jgi:branched-chain amino acid transport system permease protein